MRIIFHVNFYFYIYSTLFHYKYFPEEKKNRADRESKCVYLLLDDVLYISMWFDST